MVDHITYSPWKPYNFFTSGEREVIRFFFLGKYHLIWQHRKPGCFIARGKKEKKGFIFYFRLKSVRLRD